LFKVGADTDWRAVFEPGFLLAFGGAAMLTFALSLMVLRRLTPHDHSGAIVALSASYANTAFLGLAGGGLAGAIGISAAMLASMILLLTVVAAALVLLPSQDGRAGLDQAGGRDVPQSAGRLGGAGDRLVPAAPADAGAIARRAVAAGRRGDALRADLGGGGDGGGADRGIAGGLAGGVRQDGAAAGAGRAGGAPLRIAAGVDQRGGAAVRSADGRRAHAAGAILWRGPDGAGAGVGDHHAALGGGDAGGVRAVPAL
jgi:hypothetical protein